MRSALAGLGLTPGTKPDDVPHARCFTKAQALRLAQDLYAKAQLAPDPSIERYVAQLFGALPWVEGGALDVLDAHQDAFLVALEQHTQDKDGNGTRHRAMADQVGPLLTPGTGAQGRAGGPGPGQHPGLRGRTQAHRLGRQRQDRCREILWIRQASVSSVMDSN